METWWRRARAPPTPLPPREPPVPLPSPPLPPPPRTHPAAPAHHPRFDPTSSSRADPVRRRSRGSIIPCERRRPDLPHDPDGGVRVQQAPPLRVFDSGEDPHDPGSEVRGATGTGDLKGTLRYERGCCGTNRSARRTGRAPTRTSAAAAGVRGAQGSTREERDLRDTDHRGRRPDGRESRCSGSPSIGHDVRLGSGCDHAPASTRIWTRETYHGFQQQFMPAGASGPPRTSRVVASSRAPQEPLEPAGPPAGRAGRNFVLDS
jgi:hypothetical protein